MAVDLAHWDADVHQARGLGCVGCHGGNGDPALAEDAEAAMSKGAGFTGTPDRAKLAEWWRPLPLRPRLHAALPAACAHRPGGRVPQQRARATQCEGDAQTATCTDCHGVHGMLPVTNPNAPVYPTMCRPPAPAATPMPPAWRPTESPPISTPSTWAACMGTRFSNGGTPRPRRATTATATTARCLPEWTPSQTSAGPVTRARPSCCGGAPRPSRSRRWAC